MVLKKLLNALITKGSENYEVISENRYAFKEATLMALEKSSQTRFVNIGGIEVKSKFF